MKSTSITLGSFGRFCLALSPHFFHFSWLLCLPPPTSPEAFIRACLLCLIVVAFFHCLMVLGTGVLFLIMAAWSPSFSP